MNKALWGLMRGMRWTLLLVFGLQSALLRADTVVLSDGQHYVWAKVAMTPDARAKGLMFRTYLLPFQGMLFVFEQDEEMAFWMRNTMIPLQMRFYNRHFMRVHAVFDAKPCYALPCVNYPSSAPARYVLETRAHRAILPPAAFTRLRIMDYRRD